MVVGCIGGGHGGYSGGRFSGGGGGGVVVGRHISVSGWCWGWWGFDSRELVLKQTAGLSGAGSPPEAPHSNQDESILQPSDGCLYACMHLSFLFSQIQTGWAMATLKCFQSYCFSAEENMSEYVCFPSPIKVSLQLNTPMSSTKNEILDLIYIETLVVSFKSHQRSLTRRISK